MPVSEYFEQTFDSSIDEEACKEERLNMKMFSIFMLRIHAVVEFARIPDILLNIHFSALGLLAKSTTAYVRAFRVGHVP